MQRHPDYTRARLKHLADRLREQIYPERRNVEDLVVSPGVDRISRAAAQRLKYRPVRRGEQFGPLWTTFWFKGRVRVPREWRGVRVDLLWVSHSEATLWIDGRSRQGLNHDPTGWDRSTRPDAILIERARGGDALRFAVEMACNRPFGAPMNVPFSSVSPFVLDQCDIARFDPEAWQLYYDFYVLQELEAELAKEGGSSDRAWAGELLAELNRFANTYDVGDRSSWRAARRILQRLYTRRNATQTHELSAVGHAHIDTAWLWPIAETHRKCTRTFSSQVAYMRDYPEHKFACSQAYQYQAIKQDNPDLYARIRARVKAGQFIPVGGTWVEPDCNIPSGESLVRQFLHGQRFFERELGRRCDEFWNPDVFGYNGQLPQIMRGAGIGRFLTQKLSWNRFNKPQHHTFTWQGIDGSEVLAHFPPADTYNATVSIAELRRNARDYKDHDRSRHSLMLFGYGDGGGGPTRQMLEVLRRVSDLQGLPRTKIRSPQKFFDLLEADCRDRPTIVGELYFEYHRGTYTSQATTKRNNRKCEALLHDVEFVSAWAHALGHGSSYPSAELDHLWKLVLVNQFHDILPGSSIGRVYADAQRQYDEVLENGKRLRRSGLERFVGKAKRGQVVACNTTPFARAEVAALPGGSLQCFEVPSYGMGCAAEPRDQVTVERRRDGIRLQNGCLRAVIGNDGRLTGLYDRVAKREALAGPGNVFELYDDQPTAFDAWDIDPFHLETGKPCAPAEVIAVREYDGLRAEVELQRQIGRRSRLQQIVRLDARARRLEFRCTVDWRESHSLLKVAFPVNVRAMNATYDMQFGCVERPTHYNTSYDLARYEVPGHKWADLSEHGFGVALLSESKYGFSTFGNTMRISLLRAPKMPDPHADMGAHQFEFAI
ncbi:MAG TPA: glycoside hydrolase family 38 C-terminal domain-containing protein, partial [Candidatus Acidoferrales bacterium]|nr:glycoside hydrolase family 38 C-terminal domain-containing protein [Candidatus Acidoferrales bacterium]